MNPADADNSARYNGAILRLLELFNAHVPPFATIEWRGQCFPWDVFCAANSGAMELFHEILREMNYEMSERQCSAAVVLFCESRATEADSDMKRDRR